MHSPLFTPCDPAGTLLVNSFAVCIADPSGQASKTRVAIALALDNPWNEDRTPSPYTPDPPAAASQLARRAFI